MEREKFLKFKETFKLDEDPARRGVNYKKREYSVSKVFTKFVIVCPLHLIFRTRRSGNMSRDYWLSPALKLFPCPRWSLGKCCPVGSPCRPPREETIRTSSREIRTGCCLSMWSSPGTEASPTPPSPPSGWQIRAVSQWAFIIIFPAGELKEMSSSWGKISRSSFSSVTSRSLSVKQTRSCRKLSSGATLTQILKNFSGRKDFKINFPSIKD